MSLNILMLFSSEWSFRRHPEEFENGDFTLKTYQMFSVHTKLEEVESLTITGYFGFVFEENSIREITELSLQHHFGKALFTKCFCLH